ncbi:MAG: ABC transporter permease [Pseudomonas sp.]|jgi:peptide/nickel transport system permease protein|uniref:ABC transporter permease n=1 Tax=unclassified Pseudomonas TaxID=196821 RepID=UPI000B403C66|nr:MULTISPECIES: ABC transporter permease [unclassified Pseudomonas]MDP9028879.1 ABC transporter permease [Pseudomonadota bacterium]MDE1910426.1 ABC transporter permease [Pseudomonas sp.]MDE2031955.1 ABC transporter permease [Pseudomonas sp.]MDE2192074.1 ABC transporter permease [Pseudomonas sp.]MDE2555287.1 ABC transporter permease [Pseudomonas sp.]
MSKTRISRWLAEPQTRKGALITLLVIAVALFGPLLAPHGSTDMVGPVYGAPTGWALLGYDFLGHDVLSRLLSGGLSVLWMSVAAASIALAVGSTLGLLAGLSRRRLDQLITWLADVSLAFPDLILVLLIVSMLGRAPWLIVLTVSIAFIPGVIRLARASAVAVAGQEFVEAAQMMGYSRRRILFKEILPNILTPLLVHFGNMLTWGVGMLSGLSFLGYGVAPPTADWGLMINENQAGLLVQPWAVLAPAVLIGVFAYGTNILAEGIGRSSARLGEKQP